MEVWRPRWGIRPFRPFRGLTELERTFEDVFERPFMMPSFYFRPDGERGWMPAIDIYEKEDKYIVKAELPGMKEEDIDVSVVGDTLTIKGERKTEEEVKDEDYYRCERAYGSFMRSISLPSEVEADKIEAKYEDGVLEVSLPKAAEVKPKRVTVSPRKKAAAK